MAASVTVVMRRDRARGMAGLDAGLVRAEGGRSAVWRRCRARLWPRATACYSTPMTTHPFAVCALSMALAAVPSPVFAKGTVPHQRASAHRSALAGPPLEASLRSDLRDMSAASRYPNAAIEHLLEDIQVTVHPDGTYTETKREIIRILNKRGQDGWSEAQEGYDKDHQTLHLDWARTIEPDGHVLPVARNAIRDDSPFADYPTYDHYRVKTWTFPATIPGSILDYHVTLVDHRPALDHDFADDDYFYDFEPSRKMAYSVSMPAGHELFWHVHHADPATPVRFSKSTMGGRTIYRWEVDNQGFTLTENSMPPDADLEPSVWVSTIKDWTAVDRWWLKVNHGKARITPAIRKLVARLTHGTTDPDRKARAIYDWVVKNIRYVYVDMQYTGFESMSANDVLTRQYGDCKAGSTLLLAMLRAAGIKAHYALLETTPEGHLVTDSPALQFDHCIVAADLPRGLTFLDSVGKLVPYGTLPAMDQGALAMVTLPGGPRFIKIPLASARANEVTAHQSVALGVGGEATVSVTIHYAGLAAASARSHYQQLSPERTRRSFQDAAADATSGGRLLSYHVTDPEKLDQPMVVRYSYLAPSFADRAGDLLIFKMPGFDPGMSDFEQARRAFPMWFDSCSQSVNRTVIHLPSGYSVRYVPSDVKGDAAGVEFLGNYLEAADALSFRTQLAWKAREIAPGNYPAVRTLLERRELFGERLVVLQASGSARP